VAALGSIKGVEEMPLWLWAVSGYLSLLLLGALWTIIERTRCAMRQRKQPPPDPTAQRVPTSASYRGKRAHQPMKAPSSTK
jgi:hypothetical protein